MEKIAYGGWPNCVRLSNGNIELIATTDVGPRIIRFGFVGQENEFYEDPKQMGKSGGDEWTAYGGHRLWLAPEAKPRSYHPDNHSIKYDMGSDSLHLRPDVEPSTGIQKDVRICLGESNTAEITHTITNHNLWTVEVAPWAISVMNPGGKAILPQEPYSPHPAIPDFPGQTIDMKYLLPVSNLVLWSYTNLADPRISFTSKYVILHQNKDAKKPQKLGITSSGCWAAYARNRHLFVKKVAYQHDASYPDNGCSFETFTDSEMLELESLGPLVMLAPGASVTHIEHWHLFDDVNFENNDESIDANVFSRVKA